MFDAVADEVITDNNYRPLPEEKKMDIEREIDRVVEQQMARDVDALVDGRGDAEWQREPEPTEKLPPAASLLAISMGDTWKAYSDFPGFISTSHSMTENKIGVHVTAEYFLANYTDNISRKEIPAHGAIELSVEFDDSRVFCWQDAEFRMVAK